MTRAELEDMKKDYIQMIYEEFAQRGLNKEQSDKIIGKTGFYSAIEKYPEQQMHVSIYDAVNELIMIAALK